MRFKIIICAYNSMKWLPGTFNSVRNQRVNEYDVCVVDDASTDPTQPKYIRQWCERYGWSYILNETNMGAMYNQVHAIRTMYTGRDDDVIIFLDGDDRLAHEDVLGRLKQYYAGGHIKMTYGQYRSEPFSATCNPAYAYPPDVIANNDYRALAAHGGGIRFNHLRTVTYELFNQLEDSDFKDMNGEWFRSCTDAAIMIPCLELSDGNFKFIEEVLYIYNSENPISDWRRHPKQVNSDHDWILTHLKKKIPAAQRKMTGPKLYIDPPEKHVVMRALQQQYQYRVFIETGTGESETTQAMAPHFESLYTIELGEDLYLKAIDIFLREPKVKPIHGTSDEVLPRLLTGLKEPSFIWLDAHYCGKHKGREDTPVRQELAHIFHYSRVQPHLVLIDDARFFTPGNPDRDQNYPTIDWIRDFLKNQVLPCRYDVFVADDMIKLIPQG